MLSGAVALQDVGVDPRYVGVDRVVLVGGEQRRVAVFRECLSRSSVSQAALSGLIQVLFIGVMSCMYVLWDVIGAVRVQPNQILATHPWLL